ncbi:phage holin family protein [Candidatus Dojkabacteria bacterium]|nr:phage holin family protein [Candidatus Dojkabacteria bacterium]
MNMSTIKSFLYNFILGAMIVFITFNILDGVQTSNNIVHWLLIYLVFCLANLLVKHTIKFLTLPTNFLSYFLIGSLLSFGAFYLMDIFLPGIKFGSTLVNPFSTGIFSINPFTLSPILTMLVAGIISGLFSSLFFWLGKE